jgi:DNA-binding CsgD family transcriptional regulator/tetratricopeptide (TPR) repeat protein
MSIDNIIIRGREAFRQQEWIDAYSELSKADNSFSLEPEDLELLSMAAYLLGRYSESNDILARAHNAYLGSGKIERAIRCAFWLGLTLINKGESARGGGWISRAQSLLAQEKADSVEHGYLLLPMALKCLAEGNTKKAFAVFDESGKIGKQYNDPDLIAFSRLGKGQALVRQRESSGLAYLDEAMASVESGEVSAIVTGIVYCAVIETCLEIFDLQRAHEWTEALSNWCSSQPHMVPYRGQCLIRRSEIMLLHGTWIKAIEEAHRAIELLTEQNGEPAAGAAFYQLGELYRLQGDFQKAEEAYRQASKWGRKPQPGLALLRLVEGRIDDAKNSMQLAMGEAKDRKSRSRIIPAYVEVMLASNHVEEACSAANEMVVIADELNAPILHAMAAHAQGAVLLKQNDPHSALNKLRMAETVWKELDAPYDVARTRLLIGMACRLLGDEDTAGMEFEAARSIFHQLNAFPDKKRAEKCIRKKSSGKTHGLTPREIQVVQQIANGKSNKEIGNELFISERTVERHVSNIFAKLNVSSRSSVTAFAFKHQLV